MHRLIAGIVLLLVGTAAAEPTSRLMVRLECFDAWKSINLKEAGGGPGGVHWNTGAVACEAGLGTAPPDDVESVQLRLELGQGKVLAPVGELYIPAHPERTLAMGEPAQVEALSAAARRTRDFFVPSAQFMRALRKTSREPQTGARIYLVRFVLTARGLDAKGRTLTVARDEVQARFAMGE